MRPVAPRPAGGKVTIVPEAKGWPSSVTLPCTRPISDFSPQLEKAEIAIAETRRCKQPRDEIGGRVLYMIVLRLNRCPLERRFKAIGGLSGRKCLQYVELNGFIYKLYRAVAHGEVAATFMIAAKAHVVVCVWAHRRSGEITSSRS